jgi:hypothetical protein
VSATTNGKANAAERTLPLALASVEDEPKLPPPDHRLMLDTIAETTVIGSCAKDPLTFTKTQLKLRVEHFQSKKGRAAWEAMLACLRRGMNVERSAIITVADADIANYIEHAKEFASVENLEKHIENIKWDSLRATVSRGPVRKFLEEITDAKSDPKRVTSLAKHIVECFASLEEEPLFDVRDATQLAAPCTPVTWLIKHFGFAAGRVGLMAGYSEIGKTLVVGSLAIHVAAGLPWLGLDVGKGRVVHLDYEMGLRATQPRYQRLGIGAGVDLAKLGDALRVVCHPKTYLDSAGVEEHLVRLVTGCTLAIVDSLRAALPMLKSENDTGVRVYLDMLTRVSERTGCTIIVLVHESKPPSEKAVGGARKRIHAVRGSSAIVDAAGAAIAMGSTGEGILKIEQVKASLGPHGNPVYARIEDCGSRYENGDWSGLRVVRVDETNEVDDCIERNHLHLDAACKKITATLTSKPMTATELYKVVKVRKGTAVAAVAAMKTRGEITESPAGKSGAILLTLNSQMRLPCSP